MGYPPPSPPPLPPSQRIHWNQPTKGTVPRSHGDRFPVAPSSNISKSTWLPGAACWEGLRGLRVGLLLVAYHPLQNKHDYNWKIPHFLIGNIYILDSFMVAIFQPVMVVFRRGVFTCFRLANPCKQFYKHTFSLSVTGRSKYP